MKIKNKAIIIPGTRKSGTTTLFEMLSRHSTISVPKIKEPSFFAFERQTIMENLDAYINLFHRSKDCILLDASTYYMPSLRAPLLMKEFIEQPKILIVLRDPVKRTYSSYIHNCKIVPRIDRRSFDSILNRVDGHSEEEIISTENRYLKEAIQCGLINQNYPKINSFSRPYNAGFIAKIEDKLWIYKYFQQSLYMRQIKRYKGVFGSDVKIIFLEKLLREPKTIIMDILEFLEIEPEEELFILPHANITRVPKNWFSREIQKFRAKNVFMRKLIEIIKSLADDWVKELATEFLYTTTQLTKYQYFKARAILREEYEYWIQNYPEIKSLWCF